MLAILYLGAGSLAYSQAANPNNPNGISGGNASITVTIPNPPAEWTSTRWEQVRKGEKQDDLYLYVTAPLKSDTDQPLTYKFDVTITAMAPFTLVTPKPASFNVTIDTSTLNNNKCKLITKYHASATENEPFGDIYICFVTYLVDIDVDSENKHGFVSVPIDKMTDKLEMQVDGKITLFSSGTNKEGVPAWAAGFDCSTKNPLDDSVVPSLRFVPVIIELKEGFSPEKALITFDYVESNPDPAAKDISVETKKITNAKGKEEVVYSYTLHSNAMRLWTRNADKERQKKSINKQGHFIKPGEEIKWSDLAKACGADGDTQVEVYLEYAWSSTGATLAFPGKNPISVKVREPADQSKGSKEISASDSINVQLIALDVVDSKGKTAKSLKVGKMEGAIIPSQKKLDIERDVDRFYVKIYGAETHTSASIKLSTIENPIKSYNDDPNMIDLRLSSKKYMTKSLLLVSNDPDDDHTNNAGKDDSKNDRSHKIQLTGKVHISSVKIDEQEYPLHIKIPVPAIVQTHLDVIILSINGDPVASKAAVEKKLIEAQEDYAQVGVLLTYNISIKQAPTEIDLSEGLNLELTALEDSKLLKSLASHNRKDVQIFILNNFRNGSEPSKTLGQSYPAYIYGRYYYVNSIIINWRLVANSINHTFAHELGHILRDQGHYGGQIATLSYVQRTNIMVRGGQAIRTQEIGRSCRFIKSQEVRIHKSKLTKKIK